MAVAGCVVENPNATERDSDAGVSTIDGGVECDVSCSKGLSERSGIGGRSVSMRLRSRVQRGGM